MAWIELHTNLPRHPKTMQLQERLRMKAPTVIGHLCLLWMWALENAPDGRLNRMDAKALAKICQIPARRAEEFLDALLACGFLDRDEDGLVIHDWASYGGRYAEKRRQNKERQKRYLDKRVYRTVQYRREQNRTGQERTLRFLLVLVVTARPGAGSRRTFWTAGGCGARTTGRLPPNCGSAATR